MKHLITPLELLSLASTDNISIFDCRFDLAEPGLGRRQYLESHIPGSLYLSAEENLSTPIAEHGGRHPLPSVEEMAALFGQAGIIRGLTHAVAYDDSGAGYAARLWWMLRYLGHDNVQVLDGGFAGWKAAGGRDTREIPVVKPVRFVPAVRPEMQIGMEDVRGMTNRGALVDCRAADRFRGENETIDPIAGRIPGAVNIPWMSNTGDEGRFLPLDVLREKYVALPGNPVMYCGSGITACVDVLAYEESTGKPARLYAGSYSDWISYEDNEVETGV